MAKSKSTPKVKKVKSWGEAFQRAAKGDLMMRKAFAACLSNLGGMHLDDNESMRRQFPNEYWKACYHSLQEYISALVGEYGESEFKAEKEVLAELNAAFGYCEDKDLEWTKKKYRLETDRGVMVIEAVNKKLAIEIAEKDGQCHVIVPQQEW